MSRILTATALALSLVIWTPGAARAQSTVNATLVAPADALAAQVLVRAQLKAFAADDAEQAFAYATTSIRQLFGTPAQFMRMVRSSYPVVYRPATVVFLKAESVDGALVQPVHMTDRDGATWLALYRLQRHDGNTWRIGGCVVMPRAGKTV